MGNIAILTDSNSGITRAEGARLGVHVIPMPFYINDRLCYEDIDLTQEMFYEQLREEAVIRTSTPVVGDLLDSWEQLLKEYDEIVYIPMSCALSSSCAAATALADDYDGRVHVVNNQRISVTQRQSVLDAQALARQGKSGEEIREYLERTKFDSSIYICLTTLEYLRRGGRITPAAAALGTLLRLHPVLQIQGEKLDSYAKCRTLKQAKLTMLEAVRRDIQERFGGDTDGVWIAGAYSGARDAEAETWLEEIQTAFPGKKVVFQPLSLSVSCHIGPGSLAVTCVKKLPENADEGGCACAEA